MRIGTALVLIAVGAIMRYAVTATTEGFNINTAGLILMILGGVGLVLSLIWAAMASRRDPYREPGAYSDPPLR